MRVWAEVACRLREERQARGWSLREVADRSGRNLSVVASMEAGTVWPSVHNVGLIADLYGLRPVVTFARPLVSRLDGAAVRVMPEWHAAFAEETEPGVRAFMAYEAMRHQLAWVRDARELTANRVARDAGTDATTLRTAETELARVVSLQLLLAWARALGAVVEVVPASAPWEFVWDSATIGGGT